MGATASTLGSAANTAELCQDNPLVCLRNISRVFHTSEVETHALWGVHIEINKGEPLSQVIQSGKP